MGHACAPTTGKGQPPQKTKGSSLQVQGSRRKEEGGGLWTLVNCTNMKVYCQKCKKQLNTSPHQVKIRKKPTGCVVHQIKRQVTRTLVNHLLTDSYPYLLNQDTLNMIEWPLCRSIKAGKVTDTYTIVVFPVWIKPITQFFNQRPSCWVDRKENKQVLNQLCCDSQSYHGLIHYKDRAGTDKH